MPAHMNEGGGGCRGHGGRKVSTDWAVPYRELGRVIRRARALASEAGIAQAVVYGHAGNGHPHQNFIADDAEQLSRIERVVEPTLREWIALGATVAPDHRIRKIIRNCLPL